MPELRATITTPTLHKLQMLRAAIQIKNDDLIEELIVARYAEWAAETGGPDVA